MIGAALILVAASGPQHPRQQVAAQFRETVLGGRLGFQLYLPEATWKAITAQRPEITSALLDNRVHADINAMIKRGIRARHLPCPHEWLMSQIGPADTGGVLFVGICATRDEVRAVEAERLANRI